MGTAMGQMTSTLQKLTVGNTGSTGTGSREKPKEVASPDAYDGNEEELDIFLGQLEMVFESAPIHYSDSKN